MEKRIVERPFLIGNVDVIVAGIEGQGHNGDHLHEQNEELWERSRVAKLWREIRNCHKVHTLISLGREKFQYTDDIYRELLSYTRIKRTYGRMIIGQ